jgi:hypothetical protein
LYRASRTAVHKNPELKPEYDFERAPKGPKRTGWDYRRGVPKSSASEGSSGRSSSSSSSEREFTEKEKVKLMKEYAGG